VTPEEQVLAVLRQHPDGATQDWIARWTNLDIREVQATIQALRLAGEPILSGSYGIRLAQNADELAENAVALRRRAITQLLTARAMRRSAARMRVTEDGAMTLWR
jgi:hypothetical protein